MVCGLSRTILPSTGASPLARPWPLQPERLARVRHDPSRRRWLQAVNSNRSSAYVAAVLTHYPDSTECRGCGGQRGEGLDHGHAPGLLSRPRHVADRTHDPDSHCTPTGERKEERKEMREAGGCVCGSDCVLNRLTNYSSFFFFFFCDVYVHAAARTPAIARVAGGATAPPAFTFARRRATASCQVCCAAGDGSRGRACDGPADCNRCRGEGERMGESEYGPDRGRTRRRQEDFVSQRPYRGSHLRCVEHLPPQLPPLHGRRPLHDGRWLRRYGSHLGARRRGSEILLLEFQRADGCL